MRYPVRFRNALNRWWDGMMYEERDYHWIETHLVVRDGGVVTLHIRPESVEWYRVLKVAS